MNSASPPKAAIRAALLAWYDSTARTLPWRIGPATAAAGGKPDPYRVWLSEIMLQQTTAAAVAPYFNAFIERWPTLQALADAPKEEVLAAWAGLGYYARARNLHAAAQIAASAGGLPDTEEGLRALPGVGAYTAAAIAAIAFNRPTAPVDGNIERVLSRLYAEPSRAGVEARAVELAAPRRTGDWVQAQMDLGATLCTPRNPKCDICPLAFACIAARLGDQERYPVKPPKPAKPARLGAAFLLTRPSETGAEFLVIERPPEGLLGGMLALPSTPWREEPWLRSDAFQHAPLDAEWRLAGAVRHVFTHFSLRLEVFRAHAGPAADGRWRRADDAGLAALPTVFRKAAVLGLSAQP